LISPHEKAVTREVEYLVGILLSLATIVFAAVIGLDRERSFFATVAFVVATYYVLFALMGASHRTLMVEIAIAIGFFFLAVFGFKGNFWLVALIGHGIFDFVRHGLISNPGVPHWWPGFCMAFDVIFGGWLALLLLRRRNFPHSGTMGRRTG
jgi:hypothetical protein